MYIIYIKLTINDNILYYNIKLKSFLSIYDQVTFQSVIPSPGILHQIGVLSIIAQ